MTLPLILTGLSAVLVGTGASLAWHRRQRAIQRNLRSVDRDVWVRPSWLVDVYPRPASDVEWWNELPAPPTPMQVGCDID